VIALDGSEQCKAAFDFAVAKALAPRPRRSYPPPRAGVGPRRGG